MVPCMQVEPRVRSAALLRTQLVLVEEMSGQHLHALLPAMCRALDDGLVAPLVADCAAVIGAFNGPQVSGREKGKDWRQAAPAS